MSKLQNLMRLQQHRQIGTTTFMLKGVTFDKPAVFIFASTGHARQAMEQLIGDNDPSEIFISRLNMSVGKVLFRPMSILRDEKYVYFWGMPVQIDHFALKLLIEEEQKRLLKLTKEKH